MNYAALISLLPALLCASCTAERGGAGTTRIDVEVPGGFETEMMRVFVYDRASGRSTGELFLSGRSGDTFTRTLALRGSECDFLAYNFDIPDTFLRGEKDESTLEIYTRPVGGEVRRRFLLDDSVSVVYSPDRIITGRASVSDLSGTESIDVDAREATETWSIEIKADGARYALASGCIISGELVTLKPFDNGNSGVGSIYFDLNGGADRMYADFNTFGHGDMSSASITVFVNNGEKILNYTKSVGELMKEASRSGSHKIVIDDRIVIPAPANVSQGGGGFSPSVGEWKTETGEILI